MRSSNLSPGKMDYGTARNQSGSRSDEPLHTDGFPAFRLLLEKCQDYADLSGCRFERGALADFVELKANLPSGLKSGQAERLVAAKLKAATTIEEFARRLRDGEEQLVHCVDNAYHLVMSESVRNGIVATCREVGLWPPQPPPPDVGTDDCTYEDTTAPLPKIAQRAHNDEARRQREEGFKVALKRAATASFLVDFAAEVGVPLPTLSSSHEEMLQEFMVRVEEWGQQHQQQQQQQQQHAPVLGSLVARAREALLAGLGLGLAASAAKKIVRERWSKNWETPSGALLNAAMLGLALAATVATVRRGARSLR